MAKGKIAENDAERWGYTIDNHANPRVAYKGPRFKPTALLEVTKRRSYLGCTIDKQFPSGMYYALTSQGSVRADTIDGIKGMIRDAEKKK